MEHVMKKVDGRSIEILLVEDNEGDVLLTLEAFKEAQISNNVRVVPDGEVAMEYLHKKGKYADAVTPDLILLDINLPKKNGKQVLAEIKGDETLKRIPVVIMTSSKAEHDIVKSYELHANSYVVKPLDMDKFLDVVNAIEHFWFTVVVLPESP